MIFIFVAKEYQEELKDANSQLEHLSFIDRLTGINNNRSIMNILYNEVERGMRYKHNAEIFAESVRTTDSVGRYGGEEFLVVMPETSSKDGKIIIERIKDEINNIVWEEAPTLRISFSAGIYTIDKAAESVSVRQLIGEADKILYAAKRKGKDRVEVSV